MNDNSKRLIFGGLLVLAGVIFILQQLFNWSVGGVLFSMLFTAGAFVFLFAQKDTRQVDLLSLLTKYSLLSNEKKVLQIAPDGGIIV